MSPHCMVMNWLGCTWSFAASSGGSCFCSTCVPESPLGLKTKQIESEVRSKLQGGETIAKVTWEQWTLGKSVMEDYHIYLI